MIIAVPAPTIVSVLPDMVATEVLLLVKVKAPGLSLVIIGDVKVKGASPNVFAGIVKEIVGADIQVITQGDIIANSLVDYLNRHQKLAAMCTKNGETSYLTTETALDFDKKASTFLKKEVKSKHIVIH